MAEAAPVRMGKLVRAFLVVTANVAWVAPVVLFGIGKLALSIGGVSAIQDLGGTAGAPILAVGAFVGSALLILGLASLLVGSILAGYVLARHEVAGRQRLYAWLMAGLAGFAIVWLAALVGTSASGRLTATAALLFALVPAIVGGLSVPVQLMLLVTGRRRNR